MDSNIGQDTNFVDPIDLQPEVDINQLEWIKEREDQGMIFNKQYRTFDNVVDGTANVYMVEKNGLFTLKYNSEKEWKGIVDINDTYSGSRESCEKELLSRQENYDKNYENLLNKNEKDTSQLVVVVNGEIYDAGKNIMNTNDRTLYYNINRTDLNVQHLSELSKQNPEMFFSDDKIVNEFTNDTRLSEYLKNFANGVDTKNTNILKELADEGWSLSDDLKKHIYSHQGLNELEKKEFLEIMRKDFIIVEHNDSLEVNVYRCDSYEQSCKTLDALKGIDSDYELYKVSARSINENVLSEKYSGDKTYNYNDAVYLEVSKNGHLITSDFKNYRIDNPPKENLNPETKIDPLPLSGEKKDDTLYIIVQKDNANGLNTTICQHPEDITQKFSTLKENETKAGWIKYDYSVYSIQESKISHITPSDFASDHHDNTYNEVLSATVSKEGVLIYANLEAHLSGNLTKTNDNIPFSLNPDGSFVLKAIDEQQFDSLSKKDGFNHNMVYREFTDTIGDNNYILTHEGEKLANSYGVNPTKIGSADYTTKELNALEVKNVSLNSKDNDQGSVYHFHKGDIVEFTVNNDFYLNKKLGHETHPAFGVVYVNENRSLEVVSVCGNFTLPENSVTPSSRERLDQFHTDYSDIKERITSEHANRIGSLKDQNRNSPLTNDKTLINPHDQNSVREKSQDNNQLSL